MERRGQLKVWKLKLIIDKRLLTLIQELYSNTTLKVRISTDRRLTEEILTNKGVKQGCLLAPLLFNFYINNIVIILNHPDHSPPQLGITRLQALYMLLTLYYYL